jgi:glutamyl-Q tRNA(Asp) synthetase
MYTRVFRFAPSPNGYLHLGHAYSALLNHEMAQAAGGRLLLRIEDIDAERCRPEYEAAIHEDLQWLGVSWQQPVRRQSEHLDDYAAALARLEAEGLVYPSFESRSEISALVAERDRHGRWPRDPDGVPIYPGRARMMPAAERNRRRSAGEPYAVRLAMDAAVARAGANYLERNRPRSARPDRCRRPCTAIVGRRGARAEGRSGELSSRCCRG